MRSVLIRRLRVPGCGADLRESSAPLHGEIQLTVCGSVPTTAQKAFSLDSELRRRSNVDESNCRIFGVCLGADEATMKVDATTDPKGLSNKGLSNKVLASLSQTEFARLRVALEPVSLKFGQVLFEPGKAIRHVYFPVDCLISLLTTVDKRRSLEVGMVGSEGMAGMPFILGMGVSGVRALVQGGGEALRMSAGPFRIEFDRNRGLQDALYRYMYALMVQISQTAACNRFHEAEPRLARWLLMTRDRVMSDEFPLTHEFLAHMLGLRREGVTEAASAFKRRKLIQYQRGKIQILDLKGLRAASCSCYQIVQTAFKRVQS